MRVQFGDILFDPDAREVRRAGSPVHVSPKAFELLAFLLEVRPRALSKEDLMARLWPATFVTEGNVAGLVAELRRELGGREKDASFIRTVHGFGYAFSAEAREASASSPAPARYRVVLEEREAALSIGENLLGRDAGLTVEIDDSTVSRRHARIVVDAEGCWLEDLDSKNGTFKNGEKVTSRVGLAEGDEVRVGGVPMRLRRANASERTRTLGSSAA